MFDTLVVGIGSTVMTDDAVGHHVLLNLQQKNVPAEIVFLGQDLFKLRLFFKQHKKVIIVDALQGEYPPGKVLVFDYKSILEKLEAKIRNIHFLGSIEVLQILRQADVNLQKAEIFLVGIIVQTIDKGLDLTEPVQKAIPKAVKEVIKLIIK